MAFRASLTALAALFRVQTDKPDLIQAQVKALSTQIPLLFFITVVNTVAVAYTHYGAAPGYMTIGFSILITVGYTWRGLDWAKMRQRRLSDREAGDLLKLTVVLGPACTAIIVAWALALFQYGDAYAQAHLLFYMGVTLVSCAFCMMHLRPAAILMTVVTVIPFTIFFLAVGRPVFISAVICMLLVSAAMIYILLVFSRDFASMIDFQNGLARSEKENFRLANTDSLTELPNRRKFLFALDEALERAKRDERRLVVGLVDLDGFKLVNDLHGHMTGDRFLVEVGRRIRDRCDEDTLVARLGGDEFGILVDRDIDTAEIHEIGARVCAALRAPYAVSSAAEGSGSIGFAQFPSAGATAALLFERADYALYHAKQHRRGGECIFSIEHETEIRRQAKLEHCLRHADFGSEMSLHFQPIVDVERGRIVAFEALARWDSPTLGSVPPNVFIRVAERSDLINTLTAHLLRRALAEAETWPDDVHVSFNLSTRDLASREATADIVVIIASSGVAPSRIDLEVTETAFIQDFELAKASLLDLKFLGVGISLDDFGTGHSSLSYVRQFPIDKIKIDRSFVKDIETQSSCRAIVKSVIDLCRNLKLVCIVEGMETEAQARTLSRLGCTTMQGYFFGRPIPAAEVLDFLETADASRRLGSSSHALAS